MRRPSFSVLSPVDVLIPVPARDEAKRITSCLAALAGASARAHESGLVRRTQVVVGAHRCTDATAAIAAGYFAGAPQLNGLVHLDGGSDGVGQVRGAIIAAALATWPYDPARTWVFNTDADSCAPPAWISGTLRRVRRTGAAAVAGLVDLDSWHGSPAGRQAYDRLVAAGIRGAGHDHVYGANLAVRLDAYLAVGGFEPVRSGEDHALVRRLRQAGWPVQTSHTPVVRTSGRSPGRAPQGLGSLLLALSGEPSPGTAGRPGALDV
jgi:cellulose synthase/poly-beta-1,6-N-acetylglucosamine synthase-like glycosyltransferase